MTRHRTASNRGLGILEFFGAMALTAIVVVLVAPRLLDAISNSKIDRAAATIKSLQIAMTRYHADLGTLLPLSPAGVATPNVGGFSPTDKYGGSMLEALLLSKTAPPAKTQSGLWRKFQGPYAKDLAGTPPLGIEMSLSAVPSVPGVPTAGNLNFSLSSPFNAGLPAGSQLVYAAFTEVEKREFEKLDDILDQGVGNTLETRERLGRVKWDPVTTTLLVYIAHK